MGMLWNGTFLNAERCAEGRREFSALILHVSPYLYPFSIEYSILVGTYLLLTPLLPKRPSLLSLLSGNCGLGPAVLPAIRWRIESLIAHGRKSAVSSKSSNDYRFTLRLFLFYYFVLVGIWFIMWQNVGKVDAGSRSGDDGSSTSDRNNYDPLLRNHLVIYADCSSANRGLFAGLVVMVGTAVSIIVFFLAFSDSRFVATVQLRVLFFSLSILCSNLSQQWLPPSSSLCLSIWLTQLTICYKRASGLVSSRNRLCSFWWLAPPAWRAANSPRWTSTPIPFLSSMTCSSSSAFLRSSSTVFSASFQPWPTQTTWLSSSPFFR